MFKYNKNRITNEVSGGSMADIAFLLLIFFLVATTINEDKGVRMKLNPYHEEPSVGNKNEISTINIQINADNALLIEGKDVDLSILKGELLENIRINKRKGKHTLISLLHDRGTNYSTYLNCYNEISIVYNILWTELAKTKFNLDYTQLDKKKKFQIRKEIPKLIREMDPTSFGELSMSY